MVNELPTADVAGFDVLGDPTRRAMIALLAQRPRSPTELAAAFSVSKPSISRHLRLLRARGLVQEFRFPGDGRVRMLRLRQQPLQDMERWLERLRKFWREQLGAFEALVRAEAAAKAGRRPRGRTPRRRRTGR